MKKQRDVVKRIFYDPARYSYWLDGSPLQREKKFEVLVFNPKTNLVEWTETYLVFQNKKWQLYGFENCKLDGLYARKIRVEKR